MQTDISGYDNLLVMSGCDKHMIFYLILIVAYQKERLNFTSYLLYESHFHFIIIKNPNPNQSYI